MWSVWKEIVEQVMFDKIINKILRLKQEGEHLHAVINRIERNLTMTLNKSTRYWQVLRDYENKLYNGLK